MPTDAPIPGRGEAHPMRYARGVLTPTEGGLHPVDELFADDPEITRELLRSISLLEDGTAAVLYQLVGDIGRIREVGETSPEVLDYQLSATGATIMVYAHIESSPLLTELMGVLRKHELVLDMPLRFTGNGGLRGVVIGSNDTIRAAAADLPDSVNITLEGIGEYEPEDRRVFASLTERQQETLLTALDLGYYEVPREATHQDIADEIGRTAATVGDHLRRIERTVFREIAPR
jgi:predicted DNA binding protein